MKNIYYSNKFYFYGNSCSYINNVCYYMLNGYYIDIFCCNYRILEILYLE